MVVYCVLFILVAGVCIFVVWVLWVIVVSSGVYLCLFCLGCCWLDLLAVWVTCWILMVLLLGFWLFSAGLAACCCLLYKGYLFTLVLVTCVICVCRVNAVGLLLIRVYCIVVLVGSDCGAFGLDFCWVCVDLVALLVAGVFGG